MPKTTKTKQKTQNKTKNLPQSPKLGMIFYKMFLKKNIFQYNLGKKQLIFKSISHKVRTNNVFCFVVYAYLQIFVCPSTINIFCQFSELWKAWKKIT